MRDRPPEARPDHLSLVSGSASLPGETATPCTFEQAGRLPSSTIPYATITSCLANQSTLTFRLCSLPSWDVVKAYAQLYLRHCNYQPLPLFSEDFATTISSRDPALILAMMATALRFEMIGPATTNSDSAYKVREYVAHARELIMRRIICGPVELSTLQTLCLLSLAEFNSKLSSITWMHVIDDLRRQHSASEHV